MGARYKSHIPHRHPSNHWTFFAHVCGDDVSGATLWGRCLQIPVNNSYSDTHHGRDILDYHMDTYFLQGRPFSQNAWR